MLSEKSLPRENIENYVLLFVFQTTHCNYRGLSMYQGCGMKASLAEKLVHRCWICGPVFKFVFCGLWMQCVKSTRDSNLILMKWMSVNKNKAISEFSKVFVKGRQWTCKDSKWLSLASFQLTGTQSGVTSRTQQHLCVLEHNPAAFLTGSRRNHMWLRRAPHPSKAAEEASPHTPSPLVCCCCGYNWQG